MRQTFAEFKSDNPNLPIFKNSEAETAFAEDIKFRIRNNMDNPPKTARDWKRLYKDWDARMKERATQQKSSTKKKSKGKKKSQDTNKSTSKKKDNNVSNSMRANRNNKEKPPAHEVKNSKYGDSIPRTTTDDIDKQLDREANELNNQFSIKPGGY